MPGVLFCGVFIFTCCKNVYEKPISSSKRPAYSKIIMLSRHRVSHILRKGPFQSGRLLENEILSQHSALMTCEDFFTVGWCGSLGEKVLATKPANLASDFQDTWWRRADPSRPLSDLCWCASPHHTHREHKEKDIFTARCGGVRL